jgi:hypothetical protein
VVHHPAGVVPTRLPDAASRATLSSMSPLHRRRRSATLLDVRATALIGRGLWRMRCGRAPWRAARRRTRPQPVAMRWLATNRSRGSHVRRTRWRRA